MDASLTHWINSAAGVSPLLDRMVIAISQIGVPLMVLAVVLQWWSRTDRYHVRHAALCAGLSFLLGLAINQFILLFIHRVRPYEAGVTHLLIPPTVDWSFPSDHATASLAIVAAFAMTAGSRPYGCRGRARSAGSGRTISRVRSFSATSARVVAISVTYRPAGASTRGIATWRGSLDA